MTRQCNGQKIKDNDIQNITQKTNDPATRTPLNSGDEHRLTVPAPLVTPVV